MRYFYTHEDQDFRKVKACYYDSDANEQDIVELIFQELGHRVELIDTDLEKLLEETA